MNVIFVLTCFFMITVAAAETPVTLCGRQLANARTIICYGAEYVNKRTTTQGLLETLANSDSWNEDWLLSGRRGGLSAGWTRYKKGGLADECCLKPCTTDVILNYC